MAKNNGGPAFPLAHDDKGDTYVASGMTLRDWFAGQALAGMLANPEWNETPHALVTGEAFDYADAMIAERSK